MCVCTKCHYFIIEISSSFGFDFMDKNDADESHDVKCALTDPQISGNCEILIRFSLFFSDASFECNNFPFRRFQLNLVMICDAFRCFYYVFFFLLLRCAYANFFAAKHIRGIFYGIIMVCCTYQNHGTEIIIMEEQTEKICVQFDRMNIAYQDPANKAE